MGYDMSMVNDPDSEEGYFRANISGMQLLRGAMLAAGVMDTDYEDPEWPDVKHLDSESDDEWQGRHELACASVRAFRSQNPELVPIGKFVSNDGWHVVPEECLLIADKLDAILATGKEIFYRDSWNNRTVSLGDWDLGFAKRFADYCRLSSKHGGFRVW